MYLPLTAGLGFGLFFITIDLVSETAVMWPLTAARIAAVGVLLVFIALSGPVEMPGRSVLPVILVAGIFDTGEIPSMLLLPRPAGWILHLLLLRCILQEQCFWPGLY